MDHNAMLEKRIAYEKMLAEISEMAVRVTDMDFFLKQSLQSMGLTLDVSRVFMFTYLREDEVFACRYGWDAPSLAGKRGPDNIVLHIPSASRELMAGRVINCQNTENMPFRNYKEHLLASRVKSTLNVPLFVYGDMYGFIGFDEHRYNRKWYESDLYILNTAAQIISRTIENKIYEREIIENKNVLESIFSSVQDAIITVDASLRIIAANRAAVGICHGSIAPGRLFDDCGQDCTKACLRILKETLARKCVQRDSQIHCLQGVDGEKIATVTCSPLLDGEGGFMGAVLVIRDITRLARLESALRGQRDYQGIIGQSEKMRRLYDLLRTLTDMSTTVLITGESGTGKERIAHALHHGGRRAGQPFIRVNCSALAETLLESELFGHARGAFTGADRESVGRFEAAHGGTILLDEIGDISPLIQLKLLRVLEEKEIERVGETGPRKVDVRVLAATHRDLKKAIAAGTFREDLYYRLNVINISVPPLRERLEDIPLLVEHFCGKFNAHYEKNISGVTTEVLDIFTRHSWPGNVRELEHVIERAFVLCQGHVIRPEHIALETGPQSPALTGNRTVIPADATENPAESLKSELLAALEKCGWNVSKCSRLLGISRWTLYRRLLRHGLERPHEDM